MNGRRVKLTSRVHFHYTTHSETDRRPGELVAVQPRTERRTMMRCARCQDCNPQFQPGMGTRCISLRPRRDRYETFVALETWSRR